MGNVYDDLVDYAEILVNIINEKYLEGNNMAYMALLSGVGNCKVESYAGAGHNYQAVVDAIHNCYARNELSGIDKGYQEGISAMIRIATKFSTLQNVVNIFLYELKLEKEGRACFKVDREALLEKLNSVILDNYDTYVRENSSFAEWIERNRKFAIDNYGVTLG